MTYDAVLVARRGLGPAELRLGQPAFLPLVLLAMFSGAQLMFALRDQEAVAAARHRD